MTTQTRTKAAALAGIRRRPRQATLDVSTREHIPELRGQPEYRPTPRLMTVTPEIALTILEGRNTHNRRLRQSIVNKYARDMKDGKWRLNGETIKFAHDGTLLDGQHRLWAVVEANTAIETLVVENLPNDAQETMDTGTPRMFSDVLTLRGRTCTKEVAAAARWLYLYDRNMVAPGKGSGKSREAPTHAELSATLDQHPTVFDRHAEVLRDFGGARKLLTPSMVLAFAVLAGERNEEAMRRFLAKLSTGEGLAAGDPALMLRNRILNVKLATGTRMLPEMMWGLLVKAFLFSCRGRTVQQLRLTSTEPYPNLEDE